MSEFTKEEVLALAAEFEDRFRNVSAGRGFGPMMMPDNIRRLRIFATALRTLAASMEAAPSPSNLLIDAALEADLNRAPPHHATERVTG